MEDWRGLLNNHFEKIVLGEGCELETRVSKPLVRKFSFEVETVIPNI
jgi:hypothetical protein